MLMQKAVLKKRRCFGQKIWKLPKYFYKMAQILDKANIFINPVVFPAVKKSESILRITLMASHDLKDLDIALDAFKKAGKKIGLI
jgi:7-keto-8-aminopelargonate synthetase-like enzyme